MKFNFPADLYADVRIEHVFTTNIRFMLANMEECKEQRYDAAFVRVFGGKRWYYSSVTDISEIQQKIDELSALARKNGICDFSAFAKKFSHEKAEKLSYNGKEAYKIPLDDKIVLVKSVLPELQKNQYIRMLNTVYVDSLKQKEFYNSLGAEIKFDNQTCGIQIVYQMASESSQFMNIFNKAGSTFESVKFTVGELAQNLEESTNFLLNSTPCEPGKYTVVLSPFVTGIFAHECFGHKSESDFMIGDQETRKEWVLGKKVGFSGLSIVDSGQIEGSGFTPFDDEGNPASKTYLIKDGVLTGRLHNIASAVDLSEEVTGNARAVSYAYEPIVRMTTTYIEGGDKTFDELIAGVENGIFVKGITHGSGMSTFTLAPTIAYSIKNGKIDKPVRVSVVSGNVFAALEDVEGLANDFGLFSFVGGGCGKMEQYPLPVGFGGASMRIKNMIVQ